MAKHKQWVTVRKSSHEQRIPKPVTHVEGHVVETVPDLPEPGLVPQRVKTIAEYEQVVGKLPAETQNTHISWSYQTRLNHTSDNRINYVSQTINDTLTIRGADHRALGGISAHITRQRHCTNPANQIPLQPNPIF